MALIILMTKIGGVIRFQVLAHQYGILSRDMDIFNAANTIPELIFLIIAVGGINAALIPILTKAAAKESAQKLEAILSTLVNLFFIIMLGVALIMFFFAPFLIDLVLKISFEKGAADFSPENRELFVTLTRILLLSPIILCVSSVFSSILQIKKRFFITQLAPFFYNLGIILVAVIVLPRVNYNIIYLAWGVVFGSLLYFLCQLPSIFKAGVSYKIHYFSLKDKYVISALKLAAPRTIGLTSDYIGNIFQTFIAFRLVDGSLNSFRYALALREIATAMFGIAIAQILFPQLSQLVNDGNKKEFQKLFSKGVRIILFWTLPVTMIFIVLRTPLVRLAYGTFTGIEWTETSLVAYSLFFTSIGIIFYSLLNLINRAFFALGDSKTPTYTSMFVIFIEIILTYGFANLFSHFNNFSLNPVLLFTDFENYFTQGTGQAAIGGVAFAATITIIINIVILVRRLKKHGVNFFFESRKIYTKVIASFASLIVGIIIFKLVGRFFDDNYVVGVFLITVNVSIFMILTYYSSLKLLKDADVAILDDPVKKVRLAFIKFLQLVRLNKVFGIGTQ